MEYPNQSDKRPGETIYRVLYSSNIPRKRTAAEVESDFEFILRASQKHNLDHHITGVLVSDKRMYSQVIEGPRSVVKDLIGHIVCDSRHSDVRIISSHRSERRIFNDWSMAFVRTSRDLEAEAYLFPYGDSQANLMAVSAFCVAVRTHVLNGTNF